MLKKHFFRRNFDLRAHIFSRAGKWQNNLLCKADLLELRLSTRSGRLAFQELFPDFADPTFCAEKAGLFIKSKFEEILNLRATSQPRVIQIQPKATPLAALEEIERSKMVSKNGDKSAADKVTYRMYSHFTCATDTQNMRKIFEAVSDTMLSSAMAEVGIF